AQTRPGHVPHRGAGAVRRPRRLPRLRGLRDRGRRGPGGRAAADRRTLHPRAGPAGAAPPDHPRRSRARRVDRRLGAAPASGRKPAAQTPPAPPARIAVAFGAWTPKATVFDCDGLLLVTETVWQTAEDRVVAAHGAVLRAGAA